MNGLQSLHSSSSGSPKSFSSTLSISSGNTISDPVLVPSGISRISCGIVLMAGGAGRIEYTLSPVDRISDGQAFWRAWPDGDVVVDTDNLLLGPVTAIRCICIAGALTYELIGG